MTHTSWCVRLLWRAWWWLRNRTDYWEKPKNRGSFVVVHSPIFRVDMSGTLVGGDTDYAVVAINGFDLKITCRWHQVEVIK